MSFEWFVSLRYLRAKRKQTFISVISFISIFGVMLGVAALILVLAVMTGFTNGVRQQILGNVPHVLVQRFGEGIRDHQKLEAAARKLPQVVSVTPFVSREAMLLSHGNVAAVSVKGVEREHKVFKQDLLQIKDVNPIDGVFGANLKRPGIIIGLDTATTLGVAVGDSINVIPPLFNITPFGMIPKMKPFRIVGIFEKPSSLIDSFYAYINIETAQQFFESTGEVTGIEIEVQRFDQAPQVSGELSRQFPFPYIIRPWQSLYGSFLSALKLEKLGLFIVLAIIVLVAAFNIATTLIMVVMEKNRDIAILRAMGATASSIMKIFVFEGAIIGVLGTSLGTLFGVGLAHYADAIIKWLESEFGIRIFDQAVYGMEHFPSELVLSDVISVVVVALAISLAATIYPAWRASRMDPAEALRYE
ncbi:lipoprotein-releasing ABC transporter permease subunit [Geopsychrobacter electrodiphilus]|uniref:lipoprotein-releasing ABC transporter permease subunit n=1 Tax=Geopsychrobacter electrodiphilus TaxID=225196 RepID=UPI000367972A|nr:lipoprotein-releasing ABC transporter permease subunit [Geopsychrobacter electrodiphilus]